MLTFLRVKNILSFFHEWGDIWICKQCQSLPSGCFPELWFMRAGYCIFYHRPRKVIRQRGFPCRGLLPSLSSDILVFFFLQHQAGDVLWALPSASAIHQLLIREHKCPVQHSRHWDPHAFLQTQQQNNPVEAHLEPGGEGGVSDCMLQEVRAGWGGRRSKTNLQTHCHIR